MPAIPRKRSIQHLSEREQQELNAERIRTPEQRDIDRVEVIRLLCRGWTKQQIAEKLKITTQMVLADYTAVMKELVEERTENVDQLRQLKLQEYREVKKEAWEAWERSKGDWQKRVTEESSGNSNTAGDTSFYKTILTTEGHLPSNEYLRTIVACIDSERELLGINPPKNVKVSGHVVNWDVLVNALP